jgi:hypothetical protein
LRRWKLIVQKPFLLNALHATTQRARAVPGAKFKHNGILTLSLEQSLTTTP